MPDISKWDISKVNFMIGVFYKCLSLNTLPDISKWNTSNVNYMNFMFEECPSISIFPNISKWDISQVVKISHFGDCINSLNFPLIIKE